MNFTVEQSTRWLNLATNCGLFLGGISNLVVGTWAAASSNTAIAATCLTAGLVVLFAATIDRFESLKGLGIEAKTRKLEDKLEEADEALRKLRELAELTSSAIIEMNSKMGLWDSSPEPRDSLALVHRVRKLLRLLGSDPAVIKAAIRPWAVRISRDLAETIIRPLDKAVGVRIEELTTELQSIPGQTDRTVFLPLQTQIAACSEYRRRLGKAYAFDLSDYPENFLALVAHAPLRGTEVADWLDRAGRFKNEMIELRETLALRDEPMWMLELEKEQRVRQGGT